MEEEGERPHRKIILGEPHLLPQHQHQHLHQPVPQHPQGAGPLQDLGGGVLKEGEEEAVLETVEEGADPILRNSQAPQAAGAVARRVLRPSLEEAGAVEVEEVEGGQVAEEDGAVVVEEVDKVV